MDEIDSQSLRFKVIIIGDSGVGKSSLAARQCNSEFSNNLNPTIGSAHLLSKVKIGEKTITLVIWDTAGQEEFAPLVPMYARKANCALIVSSVISNDSISNMKKWEDMLYQSGEKPPVIGVINKMDLATDEQDSIDSISLKLKEDFNSLFFVSAKTGNGIDELFLQVAQNCLISTQIIEDQPIIDSKNKKSNCC